MIRGLASFILRGPMQATLVAAVTALLSMLLAPLTWVLAYVSGATVALVTLHVGAKQGLQVTVGAIIAAAVIAFLALRAPLLSLGFTLTLWLPTWLAAVVLKRSQSLALSVQTAVALGFAGVLVVFALVGDPAALWRPLLDELRPAFEQHAAFSNAQELDQALALVSKLMTGFSAAYAVLGVVLSLFLGRSWQAMLSNPGGFRAEFNRLRFDNVSALIAIGVFALALFAQLAIALNLSIIAVVMYLFAGLAVVHGLVARNSASVGWLVALYVLLVIALPQLVMVLALIGLADTWVNFRERFSRAPKSR